jgi:predicted O-methyltransferase YrrM
VTVSAGVSAQQATSQLPSGFADAADEAWRLMAGATGFLSESEGRFLALAAAATPASGTILEIGSFKGKSTVGLASIARRYGLGRIVAVDPHTAPSETDPDLQGQSTSFDDFLSTLRAARLEDQVEVHRTFSQDLATHWSRPIRLLWIDGDHTLGGAKRDLELYRRWLTPGAVVAFHDALHHYAGPLRVFVDDVLRSNQFGPAGFCGSIAWAQYRPVDGGGASFRRTRGALARRAAALARVFDDPRPIRGLRKLRYRVGRALIPHGPVDPARWVSSVTGIG